jgi:hypothetical protein
MVQIEADQEELVQCFEQHVQPLPRKFLRKLQVLEHVRQIFACDLDDLGSLLVEGDGSVLKTHPHTSLQIYDLLRLLLKLRPDVKTESRKSALKSIEFLLARADPSFTMEPNPRKEDGDADRRDVYKRLFPNAGREFCTGQKWKLLTPDLFIRPATPISSPAGSVQEDSLAERIKKLYETSSGVVAEAPDLYGRFSKTFTFDSMEVESEGELDGESETPSEQMVEPTPLPEVISISVAKPTPPPTNRRRSQSGGKAPPPPSVKPPPAPLPPSVTLSAEDTLLPNFAEADDEDDSSDGEDKEEQAAIRRMEEDAGGFESDSEDGDKDKKAIASESTEPDTTNSIEARVDDRALLSRERALNSFIASAPANECTHLAGTSTFSWEEFDGGPPLPKCTRQPVPCALVLRQQTTKALTSLQALLSR